MGLLIFLLGTITGGFITLVCMSLLQINRTKHYEQLLRKEREKNENIKKN